MLRTIRHAAGATLARPAAAAAAVFAGALALRLYRLDSQSLWLDEGGTWAEVTGRTGKGWGQLAAELFSPDAGYPLYHLLLKAWVAVAGDSEWALRFPSALAGALAVVVIWLAARELPGGRRAWPAALLAALSPFALWHAQDAKAYSLLLLASAALVWALLRALRTGARRDWVALAAVAAAGVFVHRLALMGVAGALAAVAAAGRLPGPRWRAGAAALALACAGGGLAGTLRAAAAERAFIGRAGVGPGEGLALTLVRFAVDRWPGDIAGYLGLPLAIWLLPLGALAAWGLALLARDARAGSDQATALLCALGAPLLLLAALLAVAPIYESRYATVAFPAWLLTAAYPACVAAAGAWRSAALALAAAGLAADGLSLAQPHKGLFSGDPVKEQWREAVREVALRSHPDDLLLVHPYYVAGMYAYYAPRVTPDPLPPAVTFPVFAEGDTCGETTPAAVRECWRRRYEPFFNSVAQGRKRALLLIAPDHARTVDPPKTLAELRAETPAGQTPPEAPDRFGWVGLRFQYPQKTWPCGGTGDAYIGVELMCQSFPETFSVLPDQPGEVPQPAVAVGATFGGQLLLRGYTVDMRGGALRPGGQLPITLYWAATSPPPRDYRVFVHLCGDCSMPPAANDDGPPLGGYPPAGLTSTWRVGDPLHDERVLALPRDLPPGRYSILIGVYAGDGSPATRLPVTGGVTLSDSRLLLGEVVVGP